MKKEDKVEKINLAREIRELKTHLSYAKNIGFFFGAGTSCALKIPNIEQLTTAVEANLTGEFKISFQAVKTDLETNITDRTVNIEDILSQIRRIMEITGESEHKEYLGVSGSAAKKLDKENLHKYIRYFSRKGIYSGYRSHQEVLCLA